MPAKLCRRGALRSKHPAAKLLLRDLSPLMLSALLYLGATTALSAYRVLVANGSREAQITRYDIGLIIGIIFFGGMLGPVLMLLAPQKQTFALVLYGTV